MIMKSKKILFTVMGLGLLVAGIVFAADHADTPTITGKTTDITDVYAFQGQNTSNMVFATSMSTGLLKPTILPKALKRSQSSASI